MYFVTYDNIRLKCYINFFYVAPHEVEVPHVLARAIDKFHAFFEKNNGEDYNSSFSTVITTSSLSSFFCIHQTILSPFEMFNSFTISFGIVHLNESEWGDA